MISSCCFRAKLCEAFGVDCEVHTTTNCLLDIANLYVSCAIANYVCFEVLIPHEPISFGVRNPITVDHEGYVDVPQGPGLGAISTSTCLRIT